MVGAADLRPGQVVISLAGRDRGRKMIVIRLEGDRWVWVADGELRRSANPKRKNRRHVQPQELVAAGLAQRLAEGRAVTDPEVRQALEQVARGDRHVEERRH